jgi:hypothetical protein
MQVVALGQATPFSSDEVAPLGFGGLTSDHLLPSHCWTMVRDPCELDSAGPALPTATHRFALGHAMPLSGASLLGGATAAGVMRDQRIPSHR